MGHVGGATHIGAIAIGSMIFNVMYWLFGFLRMSTSGLTAQAFGAWSKEEGVWSKEEGVWSKEEGGGSMEEGVWRKEEGGRSGPHDILVNSLLVALAVGLLIVVLQVPLQWLTFSLMHPSEEVRLLCTPYFYICVWGAPAVLGLYALTGWLIGMQDTRTPMLIAIAQNVVNICTSLLLVIVFGMGIEGVAIGTLVAQWVGFLTALVGVRRKGVRSKGVRREGVRREGVWSKGVRRKGVWSKERVVRRLAGVREFLSRRTLRLYSDIFLRTLCLVAVNFYFTAAGSAQGADILAANTLLMQLYIIFSYIMDGFAYAGEALAGKHLGAQNTPMLLLTVRRLFLWGIGVMVLFTLVYAVGGTSFLRLLTTDVEVVTTAKDYLPWAVAIPLTATMAFIWDGVFIGMTASRGMLQACFVAAVAFFALDCTLSPLLGNHALWAAFICFLLLRGVVQTVLFRTKRSTLNAKH